MNQQLVDVISTKAPGDTIRLGVQPLSGGATRTVTTTLVSRPGDPTAPMLGVSTFTRDLKFDFPVDVTIDTGSIGGPSAGLALTLGILDVLTPDEHHRGHADRHHRHDEPRRHRRARSAACTRRSRRPRRPG